MTGDDQLERWVAGDPQHNFETGECCPDFSCCKRDLLAPEDERRAFQRADPAGRNEMCLVFLRRMLVHELGEEAKQIIISGERGHGQPNC